MRPLLISRCALRHSLGPILRASHVWVPPASPESAPSCALGSAGRQLTAVCSATAEWLILVLGRRDERARGREGAGEPVVPVGCISLTKRRSNSLLCLFHAVQGVGWTLTAFLLAFGKNSCWPSMGWARRAFCHPAITISR